MKLFASLGESFFHKSIKVNEIMRDGGTRGKAQDGGLDLGARIKDFGGKGTNFFEKENSLEENGDGAVLGGAGEGDKAVGDFFLESDDDRFRGWSTEGELDEEWGGDGVGKISADEGAGGFDEKVLAELAQGAQAVGGQDFADLGRIQSWRLRMAWSSPGLRMPRIFSEPLP